MQGPQAHLLPDGRRLHLNHGPIDLIIEGFGQLGEVQAAYRQAVARFQTLLDELVAELPELRRPAALDRPRPFLSTIARRMELAVAPLAHVFLTPMAAVAGSVADEILACMTAGRNLDKAYVNNGGDCAFHLAEGQKLNLAVTVDDNGLSDRIEIVWQSRVRGVATSGWRGRSFSLGIADAVTVLASSANRADAAATVIANAVDLPGHAAIARRPAAELAPDNDLGERLVTVGVGTLTSEEIGTALAAGVRAADRLVVQGHIDRAFLWLGGQARTSISARTFASPDIAVFAEQQ